MKGRMFCLLRITCYHAEEMKRFDVLRSAINRMKDELRPYQVNSKNQIGHATPTESGQGEKVMNIV